MEHSRKYWSIVRTVSYPGGSATYLSLADLGDLHQVLKTTSAASICNGNRTLRTQKFHEIRLRHTGRINKLMTSSLRDRTNRSIAGDNSSGALTRIPCRLPSTSTPCTRNSEQNCDKCTKFSGLPCQFIAYFSETGGRSTLFLDLRDSEVRERLPFVHDDIIRAIPGLLWSFAATQIKNLHTSVTAACKEMQ
jgi:hypothetical protein